MENLEQEKGGRLAKALRMIGAVGFTPELPMMLGSGLADLAGTGLGTLAGMVGSKLRGEDIDWDVAGDTAREGVGNFTYMPRLRGSQEALEGAMPVMEAYDNMLHEGGAKVAEWTGSPALGAYGYAMSNLSDPWDVLPLGAMAGALRGASRVARSVETPEVKSTGMGGKERGAWSPGTISGSAVDLTLSDEAFAAQLRQHMTPAEIAQMSRDGDIKKMRDLFRDVGALDPNDLAPAALAGRAKRGWYAASGRALRDVFGPDTEQFVALLAATSPRVSVQGNLLNALTIWKNWDAAGRPQNARAVRQIMEDAVQRSALAAEDKSSVLQAWSNNTIQALTGDLSRPLADVQAHLSGPKVESFRRDLLGDFDEVTNDAWQATATGQDQKKFAGRSPLTPDRAAGAPGGVKSPEYVATSAAMRETADKLTALTGEKWTPAEVQETVWSLTKATWEKAQSTGAPLRDTLRTLRHDEVADVPDFSGLLSQGQYGQLLTDAGYGPQVATLAKNYQAPAPLSGLPSNVSITPGLEGFERQLAATFRDRVLPAQVRALRKRSSTGSDAGGGLYTRGGRVPDAGDLSGRVIETFTPADALAAALRRHGVDAPNLHELDPARSADFFHERIGRAKESSGAPGAAVAQYTPDEYAAMRLFMPEDGRSGFAIKQGDAGMPDLVSLFNERGSAQSGFAYPALGLGMDQGVKTLDAFDTVLPQMYSRMGFEEAARLPFSRKHAPEGWDYDALSRYNSGEPDVVFMGLRPWEFDARGRAGPPENVISSVGPREYNYSPTREGLRASSYAGAIRKQQRLVTPTRREGELLSIAAENAGRVPRDVWAPIQAGRKAAQTRGLRKRKADREREAAEAAAAATEE